MDSQPLSASGPGLEVDGLSRSYGATVALDEMTFQVRPGEIFGFVGGNGAGKTTTMRIILGVLAADCGEVRWDGRPIDEVARARIGYMPEERGLYPRMRVGEQLEYLAMLHGLDRAAANRATEIWIERLGVATRCDEEVQKLSLGNQQRVQLAAALVHDPELLVLDEPFSGLDPIAVDVMSQVLRDKAAEGVPVIFSSHQLDLVEQISDRVSIVHDGRMVACGGVDELRGVGPEQLIIDVPDAPPGWADGIPGAVRTEAGLTLVTLDPAADDQEVLRAALAAGPVREFARKRPSLADLFRHTVAAGADDPEEATA